MTCPVGPTGTPLSGSSARDPVSIARSRGQEVGRGRQGPEEPHGTELLHPAECPGWGWPEAKGGSRCHAPRRRSRDAGRCQVGGSEGSAGGRVANRGIGVGGNSTMAALYGGVEG